MASDKRKVSIYLSTTVLEEIEKIAEKFGVSRSKIIQDSWAVARKYQGPRVSGTLLPFKSTTEKGN